MALEPHDELGLPWDEWADGRVRRITRGRDFLQSPDAVAEAAANAARRLRKIAITVPERRPGNVFLWVQFVDHQIDFGEACPCGSTELRLVNRQVAECASCGSTIVIRRPKQRHAPEQPASESGGDRLLSGLLGHAAWAGAAAEERTRTKARHPRKELTRLGPYSTLSLTRDERALTRERFFGTAIGPGGRPWLVVVDFAVHDGAWVRSGDHPGGWTHAVWSTPLEPWGDVVDVDRLTSLPRDLEIDDPFLDDYSDMTGDPDAGGEPAELVVPPKTVSELSDVRLFSYATDSPEFERYRGLARTRQGEYVLVTVHFRLQAGARRRDPVTGAPVHDLTCLPLAPFRGIADPRPVLEPEPDLTLNSGELVASRAGGDAQSGR